MAAISQRIAADARYVLTVFAHGTLLGPAQVAAHMRGKVSVHELTLAGNKHATAGKIEKASATVINAFSKLDVASIWGHGKTAAADGSQIDTWENNLLAETSIRYDGSAGSPTGTSPTPTSPCSASRAACGRRSTSSRACCRTPPTSSPTPSTQIPKAI